MFTNNRKELEGKIQDLIRERQAKEDLERQNRETQMVKDFCEAVKGLMAQMKSMQEQIAELVQPLKKVTEAIESLGVLQDGLTAMVKHSADQLDQFTRAIEVLERSLSPTEQSYQEYAEDTQDGKDRRVRAEVREMMRHGVAPGEAQARIRERDIYSAMVHSDDYSKT